MPHGTLKERDRPLIRFLRARFARRQHLGLYFTIGFLISVVGLVAFGVLTHDVVRREEITRFDQEVADYLHARGTPFGYAFWAVISSLGSGLTVTVLGLGVISLLALRRRWALLGGWVTALIGTGFLDGALKFAIRRPRPERAADFLASMSWSFPSGHSMGSLVTYGMLAYLLVLAWNGRHALQIGAIAGALLLVLAIGFSRLYLNVHYFSDVLGGFSVGTLWLSACITGLELARRRKGRSPQVP